MEKRKLEEVCHFSFQIPTLRNNLPLKCESFAHGSLPLKSKSFFNPRVSNGDHQSLRVVASTYLTIIVNMLQYLALSRSPQDTLLGLHVWTQRQKEFRYKGFLCPQIHHQQHYTRPSQSPSRTINSDTNCCEFERGKHWRDLNQWVMNNHVNELDTTL